MLDSAAWNHMLKAVRYWSLWKTFSQLASVSLVPCSLLCMQTHTPIHRGISADIVFLTPQMANHSLAYADSFWVIALWLFQWVTCKRRICEGPKVFPDHWPGYYRCNNYMARKDWFCVTAWTWRHRHSHLNCLITQGSALDWGDCLLFMFISFFW